jgi:cation diffusion facilitator family transporter
MFLQRVSDTAILKGSVNSPPRRNEAMPRYHAAKLSDSRNLRRRYQAILLSFFAGACIMGLKFYVFRLTGSAAVLSDALESIINLVASAFAILSIYLSAKPPDKSHPYGHGKIEYFYAGFEGALIMIAAVGIFISAWPRFFHPRELLRLDEGLSILLAAGLINLGLGFNLIRIGKETRSLTLVAGGRHILTDVYTSAGVLVGLFLVRLTAIHWIDPAIACAVGVNILITGGVLIRKSFAGLMDASDPSLLDEIAALLARSRKDVWIDIHRLRAWTSGSRIHIDFHLILPAGFTLEEAHREVDALEEEIRRHFEGTASVLIHTDPCIGTDCPICGRKVCEVRRDEAVSRIEWNRETLTFEGGIEERLHRGEAAEKKMMPTEKIGKDQM